MNSKEFLTTGKASKLLGIHPNTLRSWHKQNKIKTIVTPTGKFLYNVTEFITVNNYQKTESNRNKVIYCRVCERSQKSDLVSQVKKLSSLYPNHEIIQDIGSGLNYKRKGLQKMVESAMQGKLSEIVVAHRDRLCRFGFELLQHIFETTGTRLVVLDETSLSPQEELSKDLLNILHVFSCRMYGLRRYKKTMSDTIKNIPQNSSEEGENSYLQTLQ